MKFTLVTIAVLLLAQGNNAGILSGVTDLLTSQLNNVKDDIDRVLQLGDKVVTQAENAVGSIVNQAKDTLQNQIDNLSNLVNQAVAEGQSKLVDVSNCTEIVNSALQILDLSVLDTCANTDLLNEVTTNLGNLGLVKNTLDIATCLVSNLLNPSGLQSCVGDIINGAQTQINTLEDQLGSLVEDVTNTATSCVNGIVAKLDKTLSDVTHDLQTCLTNIL